MPTHWIIQLLIKIIKVIWNFLTTNLSVLIFIFRKIKLRRTRKNVVVYVRIQQLICIQPLKLIKLTIISKYLIKYLILIKRTFNQKYIQLSPRHFLTRPCAICHKPQQVHVWTMYFYKNQCKINKTWYPKNYWKYTIWPQVFFSKKEDMERHLSSP